VAAGNPRAEARSRNKRRSSFGKRTEMRPFAGTGSGASMTTAGVTGPSEASTIRFKSADSDVPWSRASAANRSFVSRDTHAIRCRLLLIVGRSLSHSAAARLSCISYDLAHKRIAASLLLSVLRVSDIRFRVWIMAPTSDIGGCRRSLVPGPCSEFLSGLMPYFWAGRRP
jgi:hypothetical protein